MRIKLSNASFAAIGKMILVMLAFLTMFVTPAQAQNNTKHTLHNGGGRTDAQNAVIVILGDGFSSSEQSKFLERAQATADTIVNKQYPYTLFKDKINIYAIETHSVVFNSTPSNIRDVLRAQFGNTDRINTVLVWINSSQSQSYGQKIIPDISTNYDFGIGGGGAWFCGTTMNVSVTAGLSTMMHEMGHNFGLTDEYPVGTCPGQTNKANSATRADSVNNTYKWRAWAGIDGVGCYRIHFQCPDVYIPSKPGTPGACLMQGTNKDKIYSFDRVCAAELTRIFAQVTGETYKPYTRDAYGVRQADTNVTAANFPNGAVRVLDGAFHGCFKLKTVNIPASVKSIGDYAFLRCTTLTTITNSATTPQTINSTAFYGVNTSKVTLRVPDGSVAAYSEADVWKDFNIVSFSGEEPPVPPVSNYTITPTYTEGGRIFIDNAPIASGNLQTVVKGGSLAFRFEPNPEYSLDEVLIDGQSNLNAVMAKKHTFNNVVENHTIHAVFTAAGDNPIKPEKSTKRFGIRFIQNVVSDKAQMSVILPNGEKAAETKFVIYDNVGNAVFTETVRGEKSEWNLTNSAGRSVANGAYLVIAEVKEKNGKVYAYSAKLAVKR